MSALGLTLDSELLTQSLPVVLLAIVVLAILQDDFTCLVVGTYISAGDLPVVPSLAACFLGTMLGDFCWFFSGRLLGAGCLTRPPIRWVVSPDRLAGARVFVEKHGPTAILMTRFLPVIRTPVQVAAGMFTNRISTCMIYFAIAAVVYVPLLVGGSALLARAANVGTLYGIYGHLAQLGVALVLWLVLVSIRLVVRMRR